MAGKYSEIAKALPVAPPRDGAWQANVDEFKRKVVKKHGVRWTQHPANLATAYAQLRKERDVLDAQLSAHNVKVAAVEQLMWKAYEAAGVESLALADGSKIGVTEDVTVSLEDRDKFLAWIRANNLQSLLTVYAKTIESITKERLLAGQPAPDGVKLGSFKKTSLTK